MRRARFVAQARAELLEQIAYYSEAQPGLGSRFAEAVGTAVARATQFPGAGSRALMNTRRMLVKDFPFSVYYRPDPDEIVVFAIAHHARRPGYWAGRA